MGGMNNYLRKVHILCHNKNSHLGYAKLGRNESMDDNGADTDDN
jgi:hypothetical protein